MNTHVRRSLLKAFLFGPTVGASVLTAACGSEPSDPSAAGTTVTPSQNPNKPTGRFAKVGPLREQADENGVRTPEGFSTRVIAMAGFAPVAGSDMWHLFPDGAGVMALPDGGYLYISNSEVPGFGSLGFQVPQVSPLSNQIENFTPGLGGSSVLRFDQSYNLVSSYPILKATTFNCAGVVTPWNTWLSCEEFPNGQVWEVDPLKPWDQANPAANSIARPALGFFSHEAVAIDTNDRVIYMTEDMPDGRLYRFVPSATDWPKGAARPKLEQGVLQVLKPKDDLTKAVTGAVAFEWVNAKSPELPQNENRIEGTGVFDGGEGIWYKDGLVYFTTKGDNRVWMLNIKKSTIQCVYDLATAVAPNNILSGVDNITMTPQGDVLVAEDGGDMQVVVIQPDLSLKPLLQIVGQDQSEIAGIAFSPDGRKMYFTSDRGGPLPQGGYGNGLGLVYELTIPEGV